MIRRSTAPMWLATVCIACSDGSVTSTNTPQNPTLARGGLPGPPVLSRSPWSGYELVTQSTEGADVVQLEVFCPLNKVAIGGGVHATVLSKIVNANIPVRDDATGRTGWRGTLLAPGVGDADLTVSAICVDAAGAGPRLPPGQGSDPWTGYEFVTVSDQGADVVQVEALCPAGKIVIDGGVHATVLSLIVNASIPILDGASGRFGWRGTLLAPGIAAADLSVTAICVDAPA